MYTYVTVSRHQSLFLHIQIAAITVRFSKKSYRINEADGPVKLVLNLSNSSSSNIIVEVYTTDESATGKCSNTLMVDGKLYNM